MTKFDFLDRADAGHKMLETFKAEILEHDVIVVVLPAAVEIALAFANWTRLRCHRVLCRWCRPS